ncbi:hypothetical protein ACXXDK_07500 [Deinococcus sp. PESE-38]
MTGAGLAATGGAGTGLAGTGLTGAGESLTSGVTRSTCPTSMVVD